MDTRHIPMRERPHDRARREHLHRRVRPRDWLAVARETPWKELVATHQVWRVARLKRHKHAVRHPIQLLCVGQLPLIVLIVVVADALVVEG